MSVADPYLPANVYHGLSVMYFTDSMVNEIKSIPVLDVAARLNIKIKGKKAFCFAGHDRKTPSLSFELRHNIWTCFGCGRKGDNIQLVMEVFDCDFRAALNWFLNEFELGGFHKTKSVRKHEQFQKIIKNLHTGVGYRNNAPSEFFVDTELYEWFIERCNTVQNERGTKYLKEHGITTKLANRFSILELQKPAQTFCELVKKWGTEKILSSGIAWANDKGQATSLIWTSYALLFPFVENNHIIYIQGRLFQGTRKFVNPRGIPKPLFNREVLHLLPRGSTVHICEGVPDAIALEGAGFSSVGVLGATSFHAKWVDDFLDYDVVLMPDGDLGGHIFAKSISEIFQQRGKAVRIVRAPKGQDVSSVVTQLRAGGM